MAKPKKPGTQKGKSQRAGVSKTHTSQENARGAQASPSWKLEFRKQGRLGSLSWFFAFLSVLLAAYTIFYQRGVDEREGKLSGELRLSVGANGPKFSQKAPTYFLFATPDANEDARFLFPVTLKVSNDSNIKDANVSLVIGYEHKHFRSSFPTDVYKTAPRRNAEDQHHEMGHSDTHDFSKYRLTFLSPHDSQGFVDGAYATRLPYDPQAPIIFSSGLGLDVQATTFSERDIRRNWEIRYRGLRVKDMAGVVQVMETIYAKQLAMEIRENTNFLGYLAKLLNQEPVWVYACAPEFRYLASLNLFIPKGDPDKFVAFRVIPYSWELLFG